MHFCLLIYVLWIKRDLYRAIVAVTRASVFAVSSDDVWPLCTASKGYWGPILSRIPMGTLSWVNVSISYFLCSFSLQGAELHAIYISYLFRVVNVNDTGRSFKCDHPNPGPVSLKKNRCGTIKIPIGLKSQRRLVWAEIMMPGKNKHSFFEHVCVTILTSVLNIRQDPEEQL